MTEMYVSATCSNCHQILAALGGEANAVRLGVAIRNMSTDAYAAQAGNALRDSYGNPPRSMPLLAENGQLTAQGGPSVSARLRALGLIR